jgi:hypothetical protein
VENSRVRRLLSQMSSCASYPDAHDLELCLSSCASSPDAHDLELLKVGGKPTFY